MASPPIFATFALLAACGAAPARDPSALADHPPPALLLRFPDAKDERVRSRALDLPLELTLPEKAAWRITDGPTWLEAAHPPSSSKFAWRTWRAQRLVRRSDCAAEARLARPTIPSAEIDTVVEQRPFSAPPGFDSELVVGVEPSALGVAGYAIVFGASVGYCYAAVFTTSAAGAGAEEEVAARLGIAVDRVLSAVRTRSVDERAVRRRLVATPKPTPTAPIPSK